MSHKADASFFDEKKHWSKRKDEILGCYLVPYLAKIGTQSYPVFIVDAFAGPGVFGDGEQGSPSIICQIVQDFLSKGTGLEVSVLCIEAKEELHNKLTSSIKDYSFAEARCGKFEDYIQFIEKKAETHSVFLYIDPWTVEGLNWNSMESIFQHLQVSHMSIEVLINFNAQSFGRRGLAALKMLVPPANPEFEELEKVDADILTPPSIENLNKVAGGEWWQEVLKTDKSFPEKVQLLARGMCNKLSLRFNEVCQHAVKALPHHTVPKYYLIFASRHPDALLLMNDEMVKSQRVLADLAKPKTPHLFEMRSTELVPDIDELPSIILKHASVPTERKEVILSVVRECFCMFAKKEIRGCIENMLKKGVLKSETGKTRINDTTKIYRRN